MRKPKETDVNRRTFFGLGAAVIAVPVGLSPEAREQVLAPVIQSSSEFIAIKLMINGGGHSLGIDPRTTLLDALRERVGLTGTKKGCDQGQCGVCTVHLDGQPVLSCLTLAAQAEGHEITTIEGLSRGNALHPVQQAFIDHDAFQCGYCTPGQIMSAVACVRDGNVVSETDIKEFMSGNLCRCAAYPNIVAAVVQARQLQHVWLSGLQHLP